MDNSYFTPTVEDLPGINARAIFVPDTTTLFKESIDTLPRFYREHTVERFDFSGGQIQNISRKQIIQQVFSGTDAPFLHSHKTHEELYVIIAGNGEYKVSH